ncbi:MAG TPA: hypothetical protein VLL82_06225, partial [Mycobacterium sp.]|nr:hypothetical protein [Mycobacterium sp.]
MILLSQGAAAAAAWTLKNSVAVEDSYGTVLTTPAIDTTAANFLVAAYVGYNATDAGLIDSKLNTWLPGISFLANTLTCALRYVFNPVVGMGHTFTKLPGTNSGGFGSTTVTAWQAPTSPIPAFDQSNSVYVGTAVSTIQPGS